MNGLTPISLNDFEGTPPLPLEVDDEYLTTTGHAPQPPSTASYMSGFVAGLRLFQVLGQCQLRQRILHACPEAGTSKDVLYAWIEDAQHRVRALLEALPEELQADIRVGRDGATAGGMAAAARHASAAVGGGGSGTDGHERETTFGIQQANIHITALCVEFALVGLHPHGNRKVLIMCSSTSRFICGRRRTQSPSARAWRGRRTIYCQGQSAVLVSRVR